MPIMSPRVKLPPDEADEITTEPRPLWRRRPTQGIDAVSLPADELCEKIDNYFEERFDTNDYPAFCDLAGETGFDSVDQMINHARRQGGKVMRGISRALLAVGAGYEEQAQNGSRNALSLLEHLPQFDTQEPTEQLPTRPFYSKQEMEVHITGVARAEERGQHLSAQEAYLQLIKHKTFEEVPQKVIEAAEISEGEFQVLEIKDES